jgi:hypothetical protein
MHVREHLRTFDVEEKGTGHATANALFQPKRRRLAEPLKCRSMTAGPDPERAVTIEVHMRDSEQCKACIVRSS